MNEIIGAIGAVAYCFICGFIVFKFGEFLKEITNQRK